jgi:ribulose-5-phosphate 4-epimerase/fuculose-1-phosphate aldolase
VRLAELRARLVEALRRMQAGGLVLGAAGNASARDPASGLLAVSPTSLAYEDVTPADICVVRPDGELVEGPRPSSELPLHLAVLDARPDVGAVVHTHSPYATALAFSLDELPVVAPEVAAAVGGPVPVVRYTPAGTPDAGSAVVAALAGRWAVVIRNHGPVALGRDLDDALACAFAVEEAARILALAPRPVDAAALPAAEIERIARAAGRRG